MANERERPNGPAITDAQRERIDAAFARYPYTQRFQNQNVSGARQPNGDATATLMRATEATWILEYRVFVERFNGTICGTLDELLADYDESWPRWLPSAEALAALPRGGFVTQRFTPWRPPRPAPSAGAGPAWAQHTPEDALDCGRFYAAVPVEIGFEDHDEIGTMVVPPGPAQEAAIAWAQREPARLRDAVLGALLRLQREARRSCASEYERDELVDMGLPSLKVPLGLQWLAHFEDIVVLDAAREDVAYLRVRLQCPWESEHGSAVIVLHRDRVVEAGYEGTVDRDAVARDAAKKTRSR